MNIRTFFCASFLFVSAAQAAAKPQDLSGHYFLQGAMEMGSQLLLREDGTFTGQVAYGSADGYAKGTWLAHGDTLRLQAEQPLITQPVENILFDFGGEMDANQTKIEALYQPDRAQEFELAENNYVLKMRHTQWTTPPAIKPVNIYFEFSQGPPVQLLWRDNKQQNLSLPFDEQRILKKIGVSMSQAPENIQWFNVSATGRSFDIGWKKPLDKILFEQPDESNLAQSEHFSRFVPKDLEQIKRHYLISLYYSEVSPPPMTKSFDVYWHFQDGSTQQQVWADSKQVLLVQPFDTKRTLQKIGFRTQDSNEPIQWIDSISPDKRWFSINWEADVYAQNVDISAIFNDMRLEIQPNCLQVDLGDSKACYRK